MQPAGRFTSWLKQIRLALQQNTGIRVPCGDCRACCTSSLFIHIRPHETQTLSRIPEELLFPAPYLPKGHVLLGISEHGHCPMFRNNGCSIYANRPLTCRQFDCRIFTATGYTPDGSKKQISQQVHRWKFELSKAEDQQHFNALRTAARFLDQHAGQFPERFIPKDPAQRAVLVLIAYPVFLSGIHESRTEALSAGHSHTIKAVIKSLEEFRFANLIH